MLKVVEWKGKKVARLVPFSSIHFDGPIKDDLQSENVKAIAESIERGGVLQPSLVEKASGKIVCGRDRILAQHLLGKKDVLVMYVEGTAQEIAIAQIDENLCRREEDKGALLKKLKEKLAPTLTPEAGQPKPGPAAAVTHSVNTSRVPGRNYASRGSAKVGRPREGKAEADEILGAKLGVSPKTVRNRISAAKGKATQSETGKDADEEASPVSCLSPTFESCCDGRPVPEAIEAAAKVQQSLVDQMDRALIAFGGALTKYREAVKGTIPSTSGDPNAGVQVTEADLADFETWRNSVAFKIRGMRPSCVCPSCKLVEGYLDNCKDCRHRGFVGVAEHAATPKRHLIDDDEAVLFREGEEVSLREYLDQKAF